jgi:hypothetical protein
LLLTVTFRSGLSLPLLFYYDQLELCNYHSSYTYFDPSKGLEGYLNFHCQSEISENGHLLEHVK